MGFFTVVLEFFCQKDWKFQGIFPCKQTQPKFSIKALIGIHIRIWPNIKAELSASTEQPTSGSLLNALYLKVSIG